MINKLLRSVLMLGLALTFCVGTAMAQSGTIKGKISDEQTSETVIGANVYIPSLNKGGSTDTNGNFTIANVPYGDYTLRISYVGYTTKNVPVTVDQATITLNTTLSQNVSELNEVVVTALGIQRQSKSLGYSVQEVQGDELSQTKETNFVGSLTGKVAGAQINTSSALGGSSRIVLRGIKSITGNNQPLFVIDGVPLNNQSFLSTTAATDQARGGGGYDFGNPASLIDPNNIKSVTVLKGSSASALYGSRGANGVIQITTKDGTASDGLGVTINSSVQFKQVYGLPNYQNKYGGGANAPFKEVDGQQYVDYGTDASWGPRLDGRLVRQWYSFDDVNGLNGKATPWTAHPDNIKDFFNTGSTFNNNVSISHGGDDYSYQLSLTRIDQNDVFPEGKLNRKQIAFNGQAGLTDKLHASFSANYTYDDVHGRPGTGYNGVNVFQQFNQFGQRQIDLGSGSYMSQYIRPDDRQRGWNFAGIDGAKSGTINYSNNPYWVRNKNYEEDDTQRLYGNVGLTYDITDYLNVKGAVRTDYFTNRRGTRFAIGSQEIPEFKEQIREVQETNARASLNFKRDLNNSLSLDGFVAGNVRFNNLSRNINQTQSGLSVPNIYTIENSISRPQLDDYYQQKRVNSLMADATIGYNDMLFLEVNARNDWSSSLPADNNSFLYYSATGSFVFTELDGFDSDVLSFGKLRASYSKTGNDTDPYRLSTTFPITLPFGSNPLLSVSNQLNNSGLKPEQTYSFEFGARLEFFNNRANLDVSYYHDRSENQIIPVDVSRASGYSSLILNAGEITNRGLEATLNVTPLRLDNGFRWDISANWAKNVNKVVSLAPGLDNLSLANAPFEVGIYAQVNQTYGAIRGSNFKYDDNGNKIVNSDGTYAIDSKQQVLGSYVPDWTGGLSTTIHYKGFSASASIDGQKGGDIYSISDAFGPYSGLFDITARGDIREAGLIADGVQADGSKNTVRADPQSFFTSLFGLDAANVYDASYIKLREVRLAYAIPVTSFGGTPIKGITVSLIGRNLALLFKNAPNFDPSNIISSGNVQGIEAGQIPPQRSYGLDIKLDL